MLNLLFIIIFIVSLIYAIMTNNTQLVTNELIKAPKEGLIIIFEMSAVMIFWGGVLEVCKDSGLLGIVTKPLKKIISCLFSTNKNSKSLDYISMNFISNILGMGSASIPFGLKAMESLNEENNFSNTASKDMITFLIINCSLITLIPQSVIALRYSFKSNNPTKIIMYVIIVSFISMMFSILLNEVFKRYSKEKKTI